MLHVTVKIKNQLNLKQVEYEGHLESSKHGIITSQCVDKMLSNNTFLETRIQRLLEGLIFC